MLLIVVRLIYLGFGCSVETVESETAEKIEDGNDEASSGVEA